MARAPTSPSLPSTPRASSCACSTTCTARRRARIALPEQTRHVWHAYLQGVGPGPVVRLPRPRALRSARRLALQSQQTADRPVRARHQRPVDWNAPDLRLSPGQPHRGSDPRRPQLRARHAQVGGRRHALRLGRRSAARTCRCSETIIYETHVKGISMRHPDVPEDLRGTYLGPGQRADHRAPEARSASRPSSCCRSTTSSTTSSCSTKA